MLGFEFVEHQRASKICGLTVLLLRLGAHLGGPNAAGAAIGRQGQAQLIGQFGGLHVGGDGQQADHDRGRFGPAAVLRLQALDDLARERKRGLRVALHQLVEVRLVEPGQHAVAQRDHGGRARGLAVEPDFAQNLAAPKLAHRAPRALGAFHVNAQAPAQAQVGGIGHLPLLHQHLAGFELDPCEVRAHGGQHLGVHLAKRGLKVVA